MKSTTRPTLWQRWDGVIAARAEQDKKAARKRLTDLLCSGYTMADAIATIKREDVTLGIHAEEIARWERS